jgi:hypothetical protein
MKIPRPAPSPAAPALALRWALTLALLLSAPAPAAAQQIPSPEDFFGFEMGADHKLARWDKLVEYYRLLDQASDRVHVVEMGLSTLGNPFLAIWVSSPENLANLDEIQRMNALLTDPRGAPQSDVDAAIRNSRAVVVQSYGLHSTEVAASQSAAEIIYEMATRTDPEMLRILDNTVAITIPCFNPDGEIMVTDWYNETVGTPAEGLGPPELYHYYIGHDNNRDAFMQNTVESQYGARILFRDWVPQAYIDHHQMGPYGARMYVPPYADPVRPDADPLVWREMGWYGAQIAYKAEEEALSGIINDAVYSGWGHFGFHWITPFHNIAGMLTESASARLATPLFLHPDQLSGGARNLPRYEEQTNFPNPWPGGWWRVRDIVVRQKVATFSTLDIAAKNRETVLRNAYLKASRQTERGAEGTPAAFVIPADQHDPLTMTKMVNKLLGQGIEVQRADAAFEHEGRTYGAGSYVVTMAQPKRGVVRWLLGRTFYPDNTWTRNADGSPIRPYDMSTDNIGEFMGVRVDPVEESPSAQLAVVGDTVEARGVVRRGSHGYLVDGRLNDAFKAVNMLWDDGVEVRRFVRRHGPHRPGDFWIENATDEQVAAAADVTGVDFQAMDVDGGAAAPLLQRRRIAMYHRYYGGNMDEGWTRWLLENFSFAYTSLLDPELKAGNLNRKYDVIILPEDDMRMMIEGRSSNTADQPEYPEEFRSGFGEPGVQALEAFVRAGGTLVTLGESGDLPIERFHLPVRNVLEGLSSTEFWSPGSTLRVNVDNTDPLTFGMPEEALATFLAGSQAYQLVPVAENQKASRPVTYLHRDVLESGWLLGEAHLADRAAVVSVALGRGSVVLLGFRAQHRAQTHGTYKLLFNALVGSQEM